MGVPNFMFPQSGNAFGNNPYLQSLMQYQSNSISQTPVTTFINVPSEEVARQYELPPNTTGNFININSGYIYIKTTGSSILESGKFIKIRLVEEAEEQASTQKEVPSPQVNLDEYMTKSEFDKTFEPYKNIITEMQDVVKELKG